MRENISILMIFCFFFILHVYFQFYFLFVCLVHFVYLVWMLIKHYNLYTILNLIGKSRKHLCKNPEVIYHSITLMFVSFRSSTTGATSRGENGASTFTYVFLLLFPLMGRGGVMLLNLYCYVLHCIN